jgi:methylenetetrahydrofolate reductase (NADPH)
MKRIIALSACSVPTQLAELLDRFADDNAGMSAAGIEYASKQVDLLMKGGADGVHIYTMNKPVESAEVLKRCFSGQAKA